MALAIACLEACSRTLLIILNVIIVICGIVLIAVESYAIIIHRDQEVSSNALIVSLVIALLIVIVAVLGIISGIKENKPVVLNTYIFCMSIILLCSLILGIIFIIQGTGTNLPDNFYVDQFMNKIKDYSSNTPTQVFVDQFQKNNECCGSKNYKDWTVIPDSCCRESDCEVNVAANIFSEGCADDYEAANTGVFVGLGFYIIGVVIAQLLCIISAVIISIREKRSIKGHFLLLQPTNDQNLAEYFEASNYEVKNL